MECNVVVPNPPVRDVPWKNESSLPKHEHAIHACSQCHRDNVNRNDRGEEKDDRLGAVQRQTQVEEEQSKPSVSTVEINEEVDYDGAAQRDQCQPWDAAERAGYHIRRRRVPAIRPLSGKHGKVLDEKGHNSDGHEHKERVEEVQKVEAVLDVLLPVPNVEVNGPDHERQHDVHEESDPVDPGIFDIVDRLAHEQVPKLLMNPNRVTTSRRSL
mmetsp:Transcript_11779/g.27032  ORF Transcript_11779/g.27032 Transcript_11779/m.27032 type:complete len:213 (-) Transcript_11779:1220-1858(-)